MKMRVCYMATCKTKRLMVVALLFMFRLTTWGAVVPDASFLAGNEAYGRDDYQQAINQYQQCLQQGHSPEIYNNLGLAYERLEKPGHAMLYYKRGLYFFPGTNTLKDALQRVCQNKNITQPILSWYASIFLSFTFDVWVIAVSLCFWFLIVATILWKYYKRRRAAWIVLASSLALGISLFAVRSHFEYRKHGITIAKISLKIAPTQDSPTSVTVEAGEEGVLQSSQKDYAFVRFADNKEGWLEKGLFLPVVPSRTCKH